MTILFFLVIIPYFNLTSFASFNDTGVLTPSSDLSIEIAFRPDIEQGLILYHGGRRSDAYESFFSIGLVDGSVEFRFSNGDGTTAVVRSDPIDLILDHVIVARRQGTSGSLQVDDLPLVQGDTRGRETRQILEGDLYVGGVQDYHRLSERSGQTIGFVGCVKRLSVQARMVDLTKPKLKANVLVCNPCDGLDECGFGFCHQKSPGVKECECVPGEYGDSCEKGMFCCVGNTPPCLSSDPCFYN